MERFIRVFSSSFGRNSSRFPAPTKGIIYLLLKYAALRCLQVRRSEAEECYLHSWNLIVFTINN